jgi:peptidoglycan/xylan/chitin deacetylase (PgdA/CDA1 family)
VSTVPGRDVLVLCYHAVSEDWTARLSITPDRLEQHIRFLLDRGYVGATFTEAVTAPPARRTLAITFDDAFTSVLEHAYPVLSAAGIPGTVFVPTALIGGTPMSWPGIDEWMGGPYERELTGMTWDEIGTLAQVGWEIGSHTRTHPDLTEADDDTLAEELGGSKADVERMLGTCDSVAYPYGWVDDRVTAAAGAAGYRTGAGLPGGHEAPNTLRWPRAGIYVYDDLRKFRRKVSPSLRRLRGSRVWPLFNDARTKVRAL